MSEYSEKDGEWFRENLQKGTKCFGPTFRN